MDEIHIQQVLERKRKDAEITLKAIFGEKDYEIRLIEDGNGKVYGKYKHSSSFIRQGDFLYKGKNKRLVGRSNMKNLAEKIDYYHHDIYDSNDMGVFFVINSPDFNSMESCTSCDTDIVHINAQFVDIDCTDKEIRQDSKKLGKWKRAKFDSVISHRVKPSIVWITKNGLHCIWLVENGKKELFRFIQMQLIQEFQGDTSCVNESHCLRLPGFDHRKDKDNPYSVFIIHFTEKRYTQEEIKNSLPEPPEQLVKAIIRQARKSEPLDIDDNAKKRILRLVKERLDVVNDTPHKIVCHCPLPDQEDRNPSAWFNKAYFWLHCSGCGAQLPLDKLAKKMQWLDVLEELQKAKYDLEVVSQYRSIQEKMVNVQDIPDLREMSQQDIEIRDRIALEVIAHLNKLGQCINEKHKSYVIDVVTILLKGKPSNTADLVPLDIGAGKSIIIEIFISEMLKIEPNYGCVVVKERIEDVQGLVKRINERVGKEVSYPIYGFEADECLANQTQCVPKVGNYRNCKYKRQCRFNNRFSEQRNHPIAVIAHERLFYNNSKDILFKNFGEFEYEGNVLTRNKLFIDEKPKLLFLEHCNSAQFRLYRERIDLAFINNEAIYNEFKYAIEQVELLFQFSDEWRSAIDLVASDFSFSADLWDSTIDIFSSSQLEFKLTSFLESLFRFGGHKTVNKKTRQISITTSHYCNDTYGEKFHTVIFDGTADIDLTYRYKNYRFFDFRSIREYKNFVIHQNTYLKSTRGELDKKEVLRAFCKQVELVARENPESKIYLPIFKDHEDEVKEYLEELINQGKIKVDHYGGTKGKNDYLDCDIVIVEGILNKTEDYYIALHKAICGAVADDIECRPIDKVRRFNNKDIERVKISDMNCDYSQEIKRTSQRDNSKDVPGKLYIFSNDQMLLDILTYKFPGCKVEDWNPYELLKQKIFGRKHLQAKNDKIIAGYFEENFLEAKITISQIIEDTGLDKSAVSRVLGKEMFLSYICCLGFQRSQDDGDKRSYVYVRGLS